MRRKPPYETQPLRPYLSLILLFAPAVLFGVLMVLYWQHPKLGIVSKFPFVPWQFLLLGVAGAIATTGGVLDWRYHRNPLHMKIPKKERDAEAAALGLGGLPIFILM